MIAWLHALKKRYEADEAEHTATIDTFLQNPVGVADHDKFMDILKDRFDKRTHAKCCLKQIDDIVEKSKVPLVDKTKKEK